MHFLVQCCVGMSSINLIDQHVRRFLHTCCLNERQRVVKLRDLFSITVKEADAALLQLVAV